MDTAAIDDLTARITGDAPVVRAQPTLSSPTIDVYAGGAPAARTAKDAGLWARHPEDWYVEPSWCSERLFAEEPFEGTIIDPSCGLGRIVKSALDAGHKALGYDLVRRSDYCDEEEDFPRTDYMTDNIVSNPPFGLCDKRRDFGYVRRALATAENKVALLLPVPWLTGSSKRVFFETTPLSKVLIMTPRPSMPPGPVIAAGVAPGGGTEDFAWFIWSHAHKGPPTLGWLNRDG